MRRLTTGIRSEKCVVRRFRRCAKVIECTDINLDSIAYYTLSSRVCVCVYIYMYICVCVWYIIVCVCIYIYTHTHTQWCISQTQQNFIMFINTVIKFCCVWLIHHCIFIYVLNTSGWQTLKKLVYTVGSCNTTVSIIIQYYNIIISRDHCRICGPSLTETSLCGAYL